MENIDPKREYSLNEVLRLGILGKSMVTVVRRVYEDKLGDNILKTEFGGTPGARRYKIKGANLIKYIKNQ